MLKKTCLLLTTGWLMLLGLAELSLAATQSYEAFDDYTVYYNAFPSDTLQPAMAKAYGITRSKKRGLLSVSVVKKSLSPAGTPVNAKVEAKATNLTGQLKTITIREIEDAGSIYYLSEFPITHSEVLDFTLDVTPKGETKPLVVKFRQQFYTE